jgi:proteasome lid subunit RPN8/RPN11
VKAEVRGAIVAHAREAAPLECCGLLIGQGDEIVEAIRARNVADAPATRFVIDPADHFAARRAARAQGLDVIGFYHSHPATPPAPSARDAAEFTYAGYLYAIVSLTGRDAEIGLFRLDDGNFRRVSLVTVA